MHKIELVNFDNIQLTDIRPPLSDSGEMHFSSVRYPTRQLLLYLHGTVAQPPEQAPMQYGGDWSFYFKPDTADIANLAALEELLEANQPQSERLLEHLNAKEAISRFEVKGAMNDNHHLRIKLKKDDDGWKFTCNSGMTLDTMEEDLKKGTPVTLTVAPGFYFNESAERYGLFLTLKELKFSDAMDLPMRAKSKLAPVKRVFKRPLPVN